MQRISPLIPVLAFSTLACTGAIDSDEGSCAVDAAASLSEGVFRACADIGEDLTALAHIGDVVTDASSSSGWSFIANDQTVYRFGIGYVTNRSGEELRIKLEGMKGTSSTGYHVQRTVGDGAKVWIAFDDQTDTIEVSAHDTENTSFETLGSAPIGTAGNRVELNCSGISRLDDCSPGAPGCSCADGSCSEGLECNTQGLCTETTEECGTNPGALGCSCSTTLDCATELDSTLECIEGLCQPDTRALRSYVAVYDDRKVVFANESAPSIGSGPTYYLWHATLTEVPEHEGYSSPYLMCPQDYVFEGTDANIIWNWDNRAIDPGEEISFTLPEGAVALGATTSRSAAPEGEREYIRVADTSQPVVRFERLEGCDSAAAGEDYRAAAIPFSLTPETLEAEADTERIYLRNCVDGEIGLYKSEPNPDAPGDPDITLASDATRTYMFVNECTQPQFWFIDSDDPTVILKKKLDDCN